MTLNLKKVLIVEDAIPIAMAIYEFFKDEWEQIDHAGTAEQGYQLIERRGNHYDCILLDAHLPDSQGMNTIRKYGFASTGPKILHTGDEALIASIDGQAEDLGVYGILRKGNLEKWRVEDAIEKAILKYSREIDLTAMEIFREEHARYRRELLNL